MGKEFAFRRAARPRASYCLLPGGMQIFSLESRASARDVGVRSDAIALPLFSGVRGALGIRGKSWNLLPSRAAGLSKRENAAGVHTCSPFGGPRSTGSFSRPPGGYMVSSGRLAVGVPERRASYVSLAKVPLNGKLSFGCGRQRSSWFRRLPASLFFWRFQSWFQHWTASSTSFRQSEK